MDHLEALDVGDWIGLGTAFVAVIAAVISAWQAHIARSSGQRQLELAELIHREQNEPYVIVDIESYEPGHPMMVLVIENIGTTVARNVQISSDRPLESAFGAGEDLRRVLSHPIPMMPPGRRLKYVFDDADRWKADPPLPTSYVFSVQAEGPYGVMEPIEYTVDFSTLAESSAEERPLLRLEKSLEDIQDAILQLAGKPQVRVVQDHRAHPSGSATSATDGTGGSGQPEPPAIPTQ
ncbi:hypothetical protein [Streptomyces californicus]|uniref:hypothetical protein n=1 Tax=Streptomyces californicus TaxID=67351 RepID=UPI003411D880